MSFKITKGSKLQPSLPQQRGYLLSNTLKSTKTSRKTSSAKGVTFRHPLLPIIRKRKQLNKTTRHLKKPAKKVGMYTNQIEMSHDQSFEHTEEKPLSVHVNISDSQHVDHCHGLHQNKTSDKEVEHIIKRTHSDTKSEENANSISVFNIATNTFDKDNQGIVTTVSGHSITKEKTSKSRSQVKQLLSENQECMPQAEYSDTLSMNTLSVLQTKRALSKTIHNEFSFDTTSPPKPEKNQSDDEIALCEDEMSVDTVKLTNDVDGYLALPILEDNIDLPSVGLNMPAIKQYETLSKENIDLNSDGYISNSLSKSESVSNCKENGYISNSLSKSESLSNCKENGYISNSLSKSENGSKCKENGYISNSLSKSESVSKCTDTTLYEKEYQEGPTFNCRVGYETCADSGKTFITNDTDLTMHALTERLEALNFPSDIKLSLNKMCRNQQIRFGRIKHLSKSVASIGDISSVRSPVIKPRVLNGQDAIVENRSVYSKKSLTARQLSNLTGGHHYNDSAKVENNIKKSISLPAIVTQTPSNYTVKSENMNVLIKDKPNATDVNKLKFNSTKENLRKHINKTLGFLPGMKPIVSISQQSNSYKNVSPMIKQYSSRKYRKPEVSHRSRESVKSYHLTKSISKGARFALAEDLLSTSKNENEIDAVQSAKNNIKNNESKTTMKLTQPSISSSTVRSGWSPQVDNIEVLVSPTMEYNDKVLPWLESALDDGPMAFSGEKEIWQRNVDQIQLMLNRIYDSENNIKSKESINESFKIGGVHETELHHNVSQVPKRTRASSSIRSRKNSKHLIGQVDTYEALNSHKFVGPVDLDGEIRKHNYNTRFLRGRLTLESVVKRSMIDERSVNASSKARSAKLSCAKHTHGITKSKRKIVGNNCLLSKVSRVNNIDVSKSNKTEVCTEYQNLPSLNISIKSKGGSDDSLLSRGPFGDHCVRHKSSKNSNTTLSKTSILSLNSNSSSIKAPQKIQCINKNKLNAVVHTTVLPSTEKEPTNNKLELRDATTSITTESKGDQSSTLLFDSMEVQLSNSLNSPVTFVKENMPVNIKTDDMLEASTSNGLLSLDDKAFLESITPKRSFYLDNILKTNNEHDNLTSSELNSSEFKQQDDDVTDPSLRLLNKRSVSGNSFSATRQKSNRRSKTNLAVNKHTINKYMGLSCNNNLLVIESLEKIKRKYMNFKPFQRVGLLKHKYYENNQQEHEVNSKPSSMERLSTLENRLAFENKYGFNWYSPNRDSTGDHSVWSNSLKPNTSYTSPFNSMRVVHASSFEEYIKNRGSSDDIYVPKMSSTNVNSHMSSYLYGHSQKDRSFTYH